MQVCKQRPEVCLALARLLAARGDGMRARNEARRALHHFRDRAEASLTDVEARVNWAEAAVFLGDFPGAAAILQRGLQTVQVLPYLAFARDDFAAGSVACQRTVTDPQLQSYLREVSKVALAWLTTVEQNPQADMGSQMVLLEQIVKYDPGSVAVLSRLHATARLSQKEIDKRRKELQAMPSLALFRSVQGIGGGTQRPTTLP